MDAFIVVHMGQDICGEATYQKLGTSVSLSCKGDILAIDAPGDNSGNAGYVSVYKFDDSTQEWIQLGVNIDGEIGNDGLGASVSLSSDGHVIAIGATAGDNNGNRTGNVQIFQYNNTSWIHVGQNIYEEATNDHFGGNVSLSSDGSYVAIGTAYNDGNGTDAGHARVYKYIATDNSWIQVGGDIDGEAADDQAGVNVSLSANGHIVAVGANGNDTSVGSNAGYVRVFKYTDPLWN